MSDDFQISIHYSDQFRMRRLQVFNWGTFSKLHDIPIAEQGFLLVGRSGSGKSTLLDAIAALLIPPRWIDFNAAARENKQATRERDRNLLTYVRGAWAEQTDTESGAVSRQYLRTGSTWSALALTYKNLSGQAVTLMQLFCVKGNSNENADVKRYYFIIDSDFELTELEGFDLDVRKLRQRLGDEVFFNRDFSPYCERYRRRLGIENEMALRLLHKTQSAKNLGDLNSFLRDFMLDVPETFSAADRLVDEFAELKAAYDSVVTARNQVEILAPAHASYVEMTNFQKGRDELDEIKLSIDTYSDKLRERLTKERISELEEKSEKLSVEISKLESAHKNYKLELLNLEQKHRELGGDLIEAWEREKQDKIEQRDRTLMKRATLQGTCNDLGWEMPDSPESFANFVSQARTIVEDWPQKLALLRENALELSLKKKEIETSLSETQRELNELRRQPSNIRADMLELRRNICLALSIPEADLPFVGELIEVKKTELDWQGAIERVLRNFALSLLVEDRSYQLLSNYVNKTNLRARLVYYRTTQRSQNQYIPESISALPTKLQIKKGVHSSWLRSELEIRFGLECVHTAKELRLHDRAVTIDGLVRHSKTRHEKDDRRSIKDKRQWVLGFDNREKIALFEQQESELQKELTQISRELSVIEESEQSGTLQAGRCQSIVNLQWQEIDVEPLLDRILLLEEQIHQAQEKNVDLEKLAQQIEKQKKCIEEEEKAIRSAEVEKTGTDNEIESLTIALIELQVSLEGRSITQVVERDLQERFNNVSSEIKLDTVQRTSQLVERACRDEITSLKEKINDCKTLIEKSFESFRLKWPLESSNMDSTLDSAPDFFALLARLENDGLPRFEERFMDLLQNQSHQNLAALNTHLAQARKAIHEKMEFVNDSLGHAPFNTVPIRTFLRIQTNDRQLSEVRDFKKTIQDILSFAWTADLEESEKRFKILNELVQRLASKLPEDKRWKESVLDVRKHVEFVGQEVDEDGLQIEVYRSGAGKSGGQRQKLATTCLAAALHYQLNREEGSHPVYAAVVLDEAFDKADNEFTELAMNIFRNFGFQMIVATPLKSVMTLEPFVGGACFVDITGRRRSSVLMIEYDYERKRLELPVQINAQAAATQS